MPIPDFETLMKPVLMLAVEEQNYSNATEQISNQYSLSDEERQERTSSGRETTIGNRVRFAVSYLYQAGLLDRPTRGRFILTERGHEVLEENPDRVDIAYLRRYPEFVAFRNRRRGDNQVQEETEDSPLTPVEQIDNAYNEVTADLELELLDRILQQTPRFFEHLVIELLTKMGYGGEDYLSEAIGGVGDGGIDGVIHQDRLGLDVVYVQAKRYDPQTRIGRPQLQEFVGSLSGISATKGVFITTSSFSSNVEEYLKSIPQRVIPIDGNKLVQLMIQYGVGVREEQTYTLYRLDEDFFEE